MKKLLIIPIIVLITAIQSLATDVSVIPATDLIYGGESVTYNVEVNDVIALTGFTVLITYETTDFENVSATVGPFLSDNPSDLQFMSEAIADGQLLISCTILDGTSPGSSGNGILFYLNLTAKDVSNTTGSNILLPDVELRNVNNETIPCTSNGSIIIIDNEIPLLNNGSPLLEDENAYYNTPPVFASTSLIFSDNYNLNSIDFKADNGIWFEMASNIDGDTYPDPPADWTLPVFNTLDEGSHTLYWRADDDAGLDNNWDWEFYKDTEAPQGTLAISFSNISQTSMVVIANPLADDTQGDEYYEFICTSGNAADRERLIDDNIHELSGLTPNTEYTYKYRCSDGVTNNADPSYHADTCNKSPWSVTFSKASLAVPPTTLNVLCDKSSGQWYNDAVFAFTAVGGFGEGTLDYYRYEWDRNATHNWNGIEDIWDENATTVNTIELTATENGDDWYLHLKAFNSDNVPNGTLDLGPFKYDGTAPYPVSGLSACCCPNSNKSVSLLWTNPEFDVFQTHIFYKAFGIDGTGTYPAYNGIAPTIPEYANALDEDWQELAVSGNTIESYQHTNAGRNEYYYVIFVEDNAGNISPASEMVHSLSYWLGDVNDVPDGLVDINDINLLAASWGADGTIPPHMYRNVGPTCTHCRDARPVPDDYINFEDLMIFSMNYGNTCYSDNIEKRTSQEKTHIESIIRAESGKAIIEFSLTERPAELQGLNINLEIEEKLVIEKINFLTEKNQIFSISDYKDGLLTLSFATISGTKAMWENGPLASIIVDTKNIQDHCILSCNITARDRNNNDMETSFSLEDIRGINDPLFGLTKLSAHPNPIASSTRIQFSLEEAQQISIRLYDGNGSFIKELHKSYLQEGKHQMEWNAAADGIADGLYILMLEGKNQQAYRKIIIKR